MASIWQTIKDHLVDKGWDAYAPGVKTGEAESPYVVVKDGGGTSASVASKQMLYDLLLYVPFGEYGTLEELRNQLVKDMNGLFPVVKATDVITAAFPDDEYKAYMTSLQYTNYRKKERT